jgi:hypothetical protein|uniref:Uncharacterized protein n=1 Tax=viral metagenome TaxID=1070528 RepID=A0A6C0DEL5_9ZZZZ
MFAFLSLLFVLIAVFFLTSASNVAKEDFANPPSHTVSIPSVPSPTSILPDPKKDSVDEVQPHTLPGEIPVAPYEQIATMSPLPYQDTAAIKANRQQIVSLLEMLKGFLAFEAQSISEKSDPSIQLPLTTAKSDFHTLQSAVEVLNRNPGIQPTITLTNLNEMASNLAYLQEQVRLTGSAGTLQGPVNMFTESAKTEGFQGGQIATMQDLIQFVSRIQGEILRLSKSGTTDPNVTARVAALTQMKTDIQTIIDQVKQGTLMEVEIPIHKKDLDKAFPILGKPSEPLPQLIKTLRLPAGLANALPSNIQKDPATTRQISSLIDKYADQIVNGLSATFQVSYSPHASEAALAKSSTVDKTGFPSLTDLNNASQGKLNPMDMARPITDRLAPTPMDAGRGPSHFDWKQRSKEIEAQIKKRGLKQSDFGILPQGTKVSNDFSWKGYVRMICTRLQATMDPALPETCGCPPMDWKGWRIAK